MKAWAESLGVTILTDGDTATAGKFMTIGCSGYESWNRAQIDNAENGSIFGSGSSKLAEGDFQYLASRATDANGNVRKVKAASVNNQDTYHYWLEDGTIRTLIAGGLPVNFNDINSVPPEFIDMTMALGVAAAVQTMSSRETVFERLNDEDSDELMQQHQRKLADMQGRSADAVS
jgi:hypothetical protein